jgi:hypothetical protein
LDARAKQAILAGGGAAKGKYLAANARLTDKNVAQAYAGAQAGDLAGQKDLDSLKSNKGSISGTTTKQLKTMADNGEPVNSGVIDELGLTTGGGGATVDHMKNVQNVTELLGNFKEADTGKLHKAEKQLHDIKQQAIDDGHAKAALAAEKISQTYRNERKSRP